MVYTVLTKKQCVMYMFLYKRIVHSDRVRWLASSLHIATDSHALWISQHWSPHQVLCTLHSYINSHAVFICLHHGCLYWFICLWECLLQYTMINHGCLYWFICLWECLLQYTMIKCNTLYWAMHYTPIIIIACHFLNNRSTLGSSLYPNGIWDGWIDVLADEVHKQLLAQSHTTISLHSLVYIGFSRCWHCVNHSSTSLTFWHEKYKIMNKLTNYIRSN